MGLPNTENSSPLNWKSFFSGKITFLKAQWLKHKYLYLMLLPVILYYLIFCYVPMYGVLMAFQSGYSPATGLLGGCWVGLQNFAQFFQSFFFARLMKNTVLLSLYSLLFGFPAPIILALLLNEVKNKLFKSTIQTASYLPHFLSTVVVVGMIIQFAGINGLINGIRALFGQDAVLFMTKSEWFRPIYIISNIWQGAGWASIIYLAALSMIDIQLYEAAKVDGAGRWKQFLHITLPGIAPTIVIMFILRMGEIMSSDFQKIYLMQNSATYATSDVISTFVYRQGVLNADYNYSAAIGLFNAVINFAFLIIANRLSKKANGTSLW